MLCTSATSSARRPAATSASASAAASAASSSSSSSSFSTSGDEPLSGVRVHGKVQTYALAFSACDDLIVRGLHFFGTALLVYNSHRPSILGNTFRYPSASRRALGADAREFDAAASYGIAPSAADHGLRSPLRPGGEYEIAIPPIWIGRGAETVMATAASFVDNEIRFSEGPGLACAWCAPDLFETSPTHPKPKPKPLPLTATLARR